ncbi:MAG: thioesterase family protein [Candidatus Didemnitutus sp.]|nr:thioesterase family protein [Candidatus Didemnitutus sp.]
MISAFAHTRTVEFAETDMAGIVHFSNFFRWMEACETAFVRSLGLPVVSFMPGQAVGWPRVNAQCDYRSPLRFGDTVEVRLLVKEVRTRSICYVFQFRKVSDGQVAETPVAQGEIVAVCVAGDGRGGMVAQPIPDNYRTKICAAPRSKWTEA